ncbi:anti-sigma factor [Sphingomonas sp. CLY1604]|uniref:anti-sigma factor n=1 Tax=Sphingomonas sp. CLY1604 TaxID=3457786 RepID=UPI003FD898E9
MPPDPALPDPAGTDPDLAAAELALGLLDGAEREAALRRLAREPGFAIAVEWWQARLAALFAAWPGVEAPAAVARRIEATLDARGRAANDDAAPVAAQRAARWRGVAIGAAMAACLLLAVTATLLLRPPPAPVRVPVPVPVAAPPPLLAAIVPSGGGAPIAAAYDRTAGTVRIAGAVAAPAGRVAELWAIRGAEPPRSLGLLPTAGAARIAVSPALRPVLAADTVLAVSIEPAGGSPTGLPTGPVVATGKLSG